MWIFVWCVHICMFFPWEHVYAHACVAIVHARVCAHVLVCARTCMQHATVYGCAYGGPRLVSGILDCSSTVFSEVVFLSGSAFARTHCQSSWLCLCFCYTHWAFPWLLRIWAPVLCLYSKPYPLSRLLGLCLHLLPPFWRALGLFLHWLHTEFPGTLIFWFSSVLLFIIVQEIPTFAGIPLKCYGNTLVFLPFYWDCLSFWWRIFLKFENF